MRRHVARLTKPWVSKRNFAVALICGKSLSSAAAGAARTVGSGLPTLPPEPEPEPLSCEERLHRRLTDAMPLVHVRQASKITRRNFLGARNGRLSAQPPSLRPVGTQESMGDCNHGNMHCLERYQYCTTRSNGIGAVAAAENGLRRGRSRPRASLPAGSARATGQARPAHRKTRTPRRPMAPGSATARL